MKKRVEWIMAGVSPTEIDARTKRAYVFREIAPPSRLVYENGWDLPGAPLDFTVVVSLESVEAKTRLSIHMTFRDAESFRTAVERYGVLDGGTTTLDRIEEYVEGLE